jgi:hypothetical protein
MRHDLHVADVIDRNYVNFVVVMIANGLIDLPTDSAEPVDAYCDCHSVPPDSESPASGAPYNSGPLLTVAIRLPLSR